MWLHLEAMLSQAAATYRECSFQGPGFKSAAHLSSLFALSLSGIIVSLLLSFFRFPAFPGRNPLLF